MQIIFMEQITHVTKYNKDNDKHNKISSKIKNAVRRGRRSREIFL